MRNTHPIVDIPAGENLILTVPPGSQCKITALTHDIRFMGDSGAGPAGLHDYTGVIFHGRSTLVDRTVTLSEGSGAGLPAQVAVEDGGDVRPHDFPAAA